MKRPHRFAHRYIWLLLLPLLLLVVIVAHQHRNEPSALTQQTALPKTNVKNALGETQ
ncbi:MAG: hypothetical protein ACJA04_001043 [Cellvibrionaceae bacterium]|jgi:hypothetical protein